MRHKLLPMAIFLASSLAAAACGAEGTTNRATGAPEERTSITAPTAVRNGSERKEQTMQIRLKAGGTVLTALLEDNAAARDFAEMLPVNVKLKDHASTEKIAGLPKRLSAEDAPAGADPSVGDIAYYAPLGNLAIYYRDFGYSRGLVRLGRLDASPEQIMSLEGPVTIEIAE